MSTIIETSAPANESAEAFSERLMDAILGWADVMTLYFGERMGWYQSLVEHGPSTAAELAARTGTSPRYVREWLEQQAVSGILRIADDAGGSAEERRFELPAGPAEVLTDESSLAYLAPFARLAAATPVDRLTEVYRTGEGVSWAELGDVARIAQAQMNRPWFAQLPGFLTGAPELDSVLSRPGARVADVGCGAGWSSIELARAYPGLRVEGIDIDGPSVEMARHNAAQEGLSDRVVFHETDADRLADHGPFDAAFAFECLHDMPRPVDVLAAMRAATPHGPVVIMDEAVGEQLVAPGGQIERLMYALSLVCCLPDGMSHQPSAATGTVMRPDTLREYARAAGFADVDVLPIEDFAFFRFYSLS